MKFFIENKINLDDPGFNFGQGAFETLRTYNHKPFKLKDHVDRLFNSLKILEIKKKYSKKYIINAVNGFIRQNKINKRQEYRIKIIHTPQNLIVKGQILKYCDIKKIRLKLFKAERFLPQAKSLNFLLSLHLHNSALKSGYNEALLIDNNDYIREGAYSNIFIVKNSTLITPKTRILKGITRQAVLDLAKKNKIKTKQQDFKMLQYKKADEIFITSSILEIKPVKNGFLTKKLIKIFNEYTKNH